MLWSWWITNFLNIETIVVVVIFAVFIYFILTTKKKKYNIDGLERIFDRDGTVPPEDIPVAPTPKKRPTKKHLHQDRCLEIMKAIFPSEKFLVDYRPDWLKNPVTKRNLEIDVYAPNIITNLGQGLGLEYDGIQHAEYNPHFHRSPEEFIWQYKKDSWKDVTMRANRVLLIRVPNIVAYQDLERYICTKLRKEGLGQHVDAYELRKRRG